MGLQQKIIGSITLAGAMGMAAYCGFSTGYRAGHDAGRTAEHSEITQVVQRLRDDAVFPGGYLERGCESSAGLLQEAAGTARAREYWRSMRGQLGANCRYAGAQVYNDLLWDLRRDAKAPSRDMGARLREVGSGIGIEVANAANLVYKDTVRR